MVIFGKRKTISDSSVLYILDMGASVSEFLHDVKNEIVADDVESGFSQFVQEVKALIVDDEVKFFVVNIFANAEGESLLK